jgi:hypothetical protein
MAGDPEFGALLARLSDHRKLDIRALCQLADVAESELQAAFDGTPPSPSLLRRLAPVFSLHTADLFAIAGLAVPDDLAPLDPTAGGVAELIWDVRRLTADQVQHVNDTAEPIRQ